MLLVSIVGDFHSSIFPLYNEFKDKLQHHLVVDDDAFSRRKKHKNIVTSLQRFNEKHHLHIDTQEFRIDEDSFKSIETLITFMCTIENNFENIYINVTDGLANIGIVLASKLLTKGVKFISYDMYENSYNITSYESITNHKVTTSLSIEDHFLLKDLQVIQKGDKAFATRYKKDILKLFDNYAHELELLNKDITRQTKTYKGQYQRAWQIIRNMGLDSIKDAQIITGGLFEYYVYLLIKDMGFDDVEIGVKVKQSLSENVGIVNEFDILLMKNNHLYMIECKFRKMKKREIVYKYAALIHLIDDDSSMMILTNDNVYRHDIYDATRVELSDYRRAFLNRIALRGSVVKNKALFLDEIKTLFLKAD